MKTKMITVMLVAVVVLSAGIGYAAYRPDKVFLTQMQKLLEQAPTKWFGDIPLRVIQVGKTYQEGDVAYFVFNGVTSWMQLEEWRKGSDGNFHLATWICGPNYVKTWTLVLSPEGQLMDDNKIVQRDLEITSSEAIEKSEKIQKILRNAFL